MKNYEIKKATAEYTGGEIYIYYGQLENGSYFRACDDWDFISICDSDTSVEDAEYCEFYNEHEIESVSGNQYETLWNDILTWVIHHATDGNYQAYDLKERLLATEPTIETDVTIYNAHGLENDIHSRVKRDKYNSMMRHQVESIERVMSEYGKSCRFIFADGDQYKRDFEKQWKAEFYRNAVLMFSQNGYTITEYKGYTLIEW